MFDVVMISYDEPLADALFCQLQQHAPHAKRIVGISGIQNAHIAAARLVRTPMFYVVDGDCEVDSSFDFSFTPALWDQSYNHVWLSRNPVNQLEYGYGGIKCFNTANVLAGPTKPLVDFFSSVGKMKVIHTISCTTRFDQTAFMTFRATVREIVKLTHHLTAHQSDTETRDRLNQWITPTKLTSEYWYVYLSAVEVAKELIAINTNPQTVNDYQWLQSLWNSL